MQIIHGIITSHEIAGTDKTIRQRPKIPQIYTAEVAHFFQCLVGKNTAASNNPTPIKKDCPEAQN